MSLGAPVLIVGDTVNPLELGAKDQSRAESHKLRQVRNWAYRLISPLASRVILVYSSMLPILSRHLDYFFFLLDCVLLPNCYSAVQ